MAYIKQSEQVTTWEYSGLIMSNSSFGVASMDYKTWCTLEAARRSGHSGVMHYVLEKKCGDNKYCCVSTSPNIDNQQET